MPDRTKKTRLMIAGVGPIPPESPRRLHAPGMKIWGIARTLAEAGHPVRLITAEFGEIDETTPSRLTARSLGASAPGDFRDRAETQLPAGKFHEFIAAEAAGFEAEAAIGSTDVMNLALARADLKIPCWMAYFGDPMAERQLMGRMFGNDGELGSAWAQMAPALARGDRFSGCSTEQCGALLGQLATLGRLNRHTAFDPLSVRLAPWIEPIPHDPNAPSVARGDCCPFDSFLIIQTGGFNTWLDIDTLYAGIERAMAEDASIHFACTGGEIPGHYNEGYKHFRRLVETGPHSGRFHMLGWLPLERVPNLIAEANLALNIDLPCPEGRLGARNRLIDWIWGGAEAISTPGSELAIELAGDGLAMLTPHGDPVALSRAILEISRAHAMALSNIASFTSWRWTAARDRREKLEAGYNARVRLAPLIEWAAAPKPAPDLQAWEAGETPPALWREALDRAERGAEQEQADRLQRDRLEVLERRLAEFEGSRWVKLALALRGRGGHKAPPPPQP